jgi:predicted Zn finger-like uncharacterized protein
MLIQCPACHARARIPESQEGAKVRCGECGRIFVAGVTGGHRQGSTRGNQGLWIGLGVGAVALLFVVFLLSRGGDEPPPPVVEAPPTKIVEESALRLDYDSELAQITVKFHLAAQGLDGMRIRTSMHGPGIYAWKKGLELAAAAEKPDDVEITEAQREAWMAEYRALQNVDQLGVMAQWTDLITTGEEKDFFLDWRPFDGEVIELLDTRATVHIAVTSILESSTEKRTYEWKLLLDRGTWKVESWERWLSPAEIAAARKRRGRGYEQVTLSDGSKVREREPEPLPHLEDTPPELRTRIDKLIDTMLDLDLTKEASRAREDLVKIGRPTIPRLLTKLYEIPLETEDQSIQVNQVVVALRDITGQYHGYEPQELIGSAAGTTRERRLSSVKQWFAWWYIYKRTFTENETETSDALEDLIELTDKEKAWLERHGD